MVEGEMMPRLLPGEVNVTIKVPSTRALTRDQYERIEAIKRHAAQVARIVGGAVTLDIDCREGGGGRPVSLASLMDFQR